MATQADEQRRTVKRLDMIELMLAELPDVAAEWETLSVDERISWSMDWGNEMESLRCLVTQDAAGLLSAKQRPRYDLLLRRLEEALPLIDRLCLRRPPFLTETA